MMRLRILGGPGFYPGKIQLTKPPLPELSNIADRLTTSLASGMLTKGEQLSEFEAEVQQNLGVKYAIAVSSCTVGLVLSLGAIKMAKGLRLSDRKKVLIPSFTFLATASATCWAGFDPVFVDSNPDTYYMDPTDLEKKITEDTFAIVCTHVFGNPTGVDQILAVAKKHSLPVVFDAAHGFGIQHDGKPVGGEGSASSFSLTPTKLLTSGEGGFVTTNDEEVTYNIRILREYGTRIGHHDMVYPGLNGRMSELHAILGRWGLTKLDDEANNRNKRVEKYKELLKGIPGIAFQKIDKGDRCSYKDLGIKIDGEKFGLTRDQLIKALSAENFECKTYFCPPVHKHTYFAKDAGGQDTCPNATKLSEQMLCPPLYGNMSNAQQEAIAGAIIDAHKHSAEIKKVLG